MYSIIILHALQFGVPMVPYIRSLQCYKKIVVFIVFFNPKNVVYDMRT